MVNKMCEMKVILNIFLAIGGTSGHNVLQRISHLIVQKR
jgi:hypothetical protein